MSCGLGREVFDTAIPAIATVLAAVGVGGLIVAIGLGVLLVAAWASRR